MGYIPGTRWHKVECKVGLVEVSLSVNLLGDILMKDAEKESR